MLGWLLERKFSPALLIEFTEMPPGRRAGRREPRGPHGRTRRERPRIRGAIERMQAADAGDDDPLDSDIAFHVAVLRASRNRFYAQLTGFTATALRFSIRTTNRYKGVQLASVADHKKVADAIIAGRSAAAGEAMRKLIQEALDLINSREELQAGRRTVANSGR